MAGDKVQFKLTGGQSNGGVTYSWRNNLISAHASRNEGYLSVQFIIFAMAGDRDGSLLESTTIYLAEGDTGISQGLPAWSNGNRE